MKESPNSDVTPGKLEYFFFLHPMIFLMSFQTNGVQKWVPLTSHPVHHRELLLDLIYY